MTWNLAPCLPCSDGEGEEEGGDEAGSVLPLTSRLTLIDETKESPKATDPATARSSATHLLQQRKVRRCYSSGSTSDTSCLATGAAGIAGAAAGMGASGPATAPSAVLPALTGVEGDQQQGRKHPVSGVCLPQAHGSQAQQLLMARRSPPAATAEGMGAGLPEAVPRVAVTLPKAMQEQQQEQGPQQRQVLQDKQVQQQGQQAQQAHQQREEQQQAVHGAGKSVERAHTASPTVVVPLHDAGSMSQTLAQLLASREYRLTVGMQPPSSLGSGGAPAALQRQHSMSDMLREMEEAGWAGGVSARGSAHGRPGTDLSTSTGPGSAPVAASLMGLHSHPSQQAGHAGPGALAGAGSGPAMAASAAAAAWITGRSTGLGAGPVTAAAPGVPVMNWLDHKVMLAGEKGVHAGGFLMPVLPNDNPMVDPSVVGAGAMRHAPPPELPLKQNPQQKQQKQVHPGGPRTSERMGAASAPCPSAMPLHGSYPRAPAAAWATTRGCPGLAAALTFARRSVP